LQPSFSLTNLYNARPTWLDEAVFAAYGWLDDPSDDEILEELFELNLHRSSDPVIRRGQMPNNRRSVDRRKFGYFMPVVDNKSEEVFGHLSDISPRGFKLDCRKPLATKVDYDLRLDLTAEIASVPSISFIARGLWIQPDPINPNEYVQGFQLVSISPPMS
jgi:hypothetical protein